MVNNEIVSLMKRRVDALMTDEMVIIRDYCNYKIDLQQNSKKVPKKKMRLPEKC